MKLRKHIRSSSGFTVAELMTTVGVAAILIGIAVPGFLSWLPTLHLSDAARQVATDLQLARMTAISQNTATTVAFNVTNATYSFGTESRDLSDLYPGITISSVTPANPTFSMRGTVTGGGTTTITLSNGSDTKQVQVNSVGRVAMP
ncbi:MAG: GspH/FimT family pseudopilin [Candidatus Binatia bacterium]